MTDIVTVDQQQARALTDRIKVAVEGTWLLIQEAYTSRAWGALGYETWDDYCNAEFGTARLRLPREERQEVVASLRENGLSLRAIASATGASINTVQADLQVSQIDTPAEITGADGKSYAASRPGASENELLAGADWVMDEPADLVEMAGTETVTPTVNIRPPEPAKPKRRPLPEAFAEAALDLAKTSERLTRLREDNRFTRNRDQTHHQMPDLITALENATALIQAMDLGSTANEEARRWWAASLHKTSDALRDVADTLQKES